MNDQMDEIIAFYEFLDKFNARQQWLDNTRHELSKTKKVLVVSVWMCATPMGLWIDQAFNWSLSPEGNDYWNQLNTKWCNEIEV